MPNESAFDHFLNGILGLISKKKAKEDMEFFIVDKKRFTSNYAFGEEADPVILGEPDYCEICGKPISLRKWLPPHKVILEKPVYGDFVFGGFSEMLVSKRFMQLYKEKKLKGIQSFFPVQIVKIRRKRENSPEPPQYYKIEIKRTNTLIDEKASGLKREFDKGQTFCKICQTGGIIKTFNGIYIQENSWTNEDIFYASGLPGEIIVTQSFVDFVKDNKFTNITFVNSKEYKPLWAGGSVG